MIEYIKRKDLEDAKYNACIKNSIQSRIYAFSWYLDIVADNWDVLVLDDYDAVMPIIWSQKYLIKYIAQPPFCQQLGVFSLDEISEEIQQNFIAKIPLKYLKVQLVFNSKNLIIKKNLRVNYVLDLSNEYSEVKKQFSKGRKHAIKVAEKNCLTIKDVNISSLIEIQKQHYNYIISETKFKNLAIALINKNKGQVLGVFKDDVLIGGGFFIKSKSRIIYLYSSFNADGRKYQAASFLINYVIQKNIKSNFYLDFEGGNLPNIGKFYRSFGAEQEDYSFLERTLL
ncbi:hypothetical protein KO506_00430 [Polaribacter vadi]|uniref:hypothetical protein n=1 Tax=Polaribacter TaxID=52959 RepID=UPI001C09C944|nr:MULTISPECIES: hypothetical protein [Polaribacter]MBU3009865.1 hypothetical protein [Polaribacter vadi]MDO6739671.1 hypothetical protein [Polaribacter sp. 1_MG-2023]